MKIRSITYFCDPGWPLRRELLEKAGAFISEARPAYHAAGFIVQTARLATSPFPVVLADRIQSEIVPFSRELERSAHEIGYDYVSIGPAEPAFAESYAVIPEVLRDTKTVFTAGMIASRRDGISLQAVRACASVVKRCSTLSPDGFGNLRFAALANVPPGAPFFPAGYHDGGAPSFALATEAADLAVSAVSNSNSLKEARDQLIESVERAADQLGSISENLAGRFGLNFGGIDFSLAPFPNRETSIGGALERLGVRKVGMPGSLAAAAFITDAMDRASYPRAGFNGLFLPVLEDTALAERNAEGLLDINDLLLYSAVCGTGLDTLPLPGDVSIEQLSAILLDLAALALRLDKPLTARLLPIPGKKAGEPTNFDFAYFSNSRILPVKGEPVTGLLAGDGNFPINQRRPSNPE